MAPLDTFRAAVAGGGRKTGMQWLFRCPAHEDERPSLSVRELDDGTLLLRCFAGCQTEDVLTALGLEYADLYPARSW